MLVDGVNNEWINNEWQLWEWTSCVTHRHSMEKTVGARDDQGSYRGGNVNGTLLGSQRGQDVAAGWEITRDHRYGRSWRWSATGTGREPMSLWKVCTRKEKHAVCRNNVGSQLSVHRQSICTSSWFTEGFKHYVWYIKLIKMMKKFKNNEMDAKKSLTTCV